MLTAQFYFYIRMYILGQYYQVLCNSLSGPALSIWVFDITLSGPAFQIVFVYHSINVKFYIYRILIESVSLSSIIPKSFVYYSKKDHYQHIYRPFILWRFHLVDFEKNIWILFMNKTFLALFCLWQRFNCQISLSTNLKTIHSLKISPCGFW